MLKGFSLSLDALFALFLLSLLLPTTISPPPHFLTHDTNRWNVGVEYLGRLGMGEGGGETGFPCVFTDVNATVKSGEVNVYVVRC